VAENWVDRLGSVVSDSLFISERLLISNWFLISFFSDGLFIGDNDYQLFFFISDWFFISDELFISDWSIISEGLFITD
jgi:hypothetical protein